ncbi:MAG: hypothetical protein WD942_07300 [Dehalococcoidia bacterium]
MGTIAGSQSFTRTHAKYLASKVIADLYQCARLYGRPSTDDIPDYEAELVELLAGGYVNEYEFGFKQDGKRVVSWQYRVTAGGDLIGGGTDDGAGGVYARAQVAGAGYFNFLSYSQKWFDLASSDRDRFNEELPISRAAGQLPADGDGYWFQDRTYTSSGTAVARRTFRPS